jgi:hypothetical protein
VLALAPFDSARTHVQDFEQRRYCHDPEPYRRLLGRFEDAAIGFALNAASHHPNSLACVLEPVDGTAVSIFMARWLYSADRRRTVALRWFDRHLHGAAADLTAIALGRSGRDRFPAETALRILAEAGHRDVLGAAAAACHPDAPAAVATIVDADPVRLLPKRIPKPRRWIAPDRLPRVLLDNRQAALPLSAVLDFVTMLMMYRPGRDYAGAYLVTRALDSASAIGFARALLDQWVEAEYPVRNNWLLRAQTILGCGLEPEENRRYITLSRQWHLSRQRQQWQQRQWRKFEAR